MAAAQANTVKHKAGLLLLTCMSVISVNACMTKNTRRKQSLIQYTPDQLLLMRGEMNFPYFDYKQLRHAIPFELLRRKRGKRLGIQVKLRQRGHRIPLPTVIFGTVRSNR